jgi:hypothetical protein
MIRAPLLAAALLRTFTRHVADEFGDDNWEAWL